MKKLLIGLFLILSATAGYALESVWRSSTTSTADGAGRLCARRGELYRVIVSSAGGDLARTSVWNSTFTPAAAYQSIGPIDASRTTGNFEYRVQFSSGLVYTTTGTATYTFLYDCY